MMLTSLVTCIDSIQFDSLDIYKVKFNTADPLALCNEFKKHQACLSAEVNVVSLTKNSSFYNTTSDLMNAVSKINYYNYQWNIENSLYPLFDINVLDIPIFGMVKDDKHSTRALMNEKREELSISNKLFNLITMFQDSVHDTAIGYHKKLRDKELTKSALDDIQGIGEIRKRALLKKFGSINKIAEADVSEITKIKGINAELAKHIKEDLN